MKAQNVPNYMQAYIKSKRTENYCKIKPQTVPFKIQSNLKKQRYVVTVTLPLFLYLIQYTSLKTLDKEWNVHITQKKLNNTHKTHWFIPQIRKHVWDTGTTQNR